MRYIARLIGAGDPLGERARHNASGPEVPEEQAVAWLRDWPRLLAPEPTAAV